MPRRHDTTRGLGIRCRCAAGFSVGLRDVASYRLAREWNPILRMRCSCSICQIDSCRSARFTKLVMLFGVAGLAPQLSWITVCENWR